MSFLCLIEKDILLIQETQPQLIYKPKNKILTGFLHFEGEYQGYRIKDKYNIEIDFNNHQPLPLVKEIDGRIEQISKDKNLDLIDLHINYGDINKGLCLCSRFKAFEYAEKLKYSLSPGTDFIQELIIPFLYSISYFEKYDEFPFGAMEHGIPGLIREITNNKEYFKYLQSYIKILPAEAIKFIHEYAHFFNLENVIYKNEKIGRNKPCPCNSGLKYKKCHLNIVNILSNCLFIIQKKEPLFRRSSISM